MGILAVEPLGALGAAGQNTEASQIDLPPQYATSAINCYTAQNGKLTARKSIIRRTADNANLTTALPVVRVYRHNLADGTSVFACSGNNRIFTATTTTLTSRSSGHSADLWQFATLNGKLFAAQASHTLRYFDESTWAETTVATPASPRAITAAHGRLWALSSDGWTLYWSDLLDGTNFTSGASGSLDLLKLHTAVRSPATAVVAFNRQILVLCREQILVLGLADNLNPNDGTTPIYLADAINGVGCISRDTVVPTGNDLLFLAADGVRSLTRTLAEKQAPTQLSALSVLNKTMLREYVRGEADDAAISAAWDQENNRYLLMLPTANTVFVFDLVENPPRTTIWQMGDRPVYHAASWTDNTLWFGATGGLADNSEYDGDDSYQMTVITGWLSMSVASLLKHLKMLIVNATGGSGQTATLKWYSDFDPATYRSASFSMLSGTQPAYYGVSEYNENEYSTGVAALESRLHLGGSAKFFRFELSIPVGGYELSLNNVQVFTNKGRVS